jgi:integrase
MNDIEDLIHWNKIKISMPKVKEFADGRAPTIDEIRKLVEYNDIRIKPIVYTMAPSGIRLGAWEYLKWKHVIPIRDENDPCVIKSAKLVVYAGDPEQYYTFISPEAYYALEQWIELRKRHGENVTGES